jgi:hypothetical protein
MDLRKNGKDKNNWIIKRQIETRNHQNLSWKTHQPVTHSGSQAIDQYKVNHCKVNTNQNWWI